MTQPLTVLVLTPSLGGDFFGDILTGLAREVVGAEGRLVVIETLQEHSPRDEAGEQGRYSTPVAWSQVDAVVSVTTAVGADYLRKVRAAGKPVVLLSSTQLGDFDAPTTRPDNFDGTTAAVEHLISHGHTRIGFVGNLAQRDISDRYGAYHQALADHGIMPDPDLKFDTPENGETGGAVAARDILAAPQRPTAVMVATDRNAIGLMHELTLAGLALPEDLAIVSFDNIAAAAFSAPTLTSVDPRFDEVGALTGRLTLRAIQGEDVPAATHTPASAVLEVRESCGCEPAARRTLELGHNELDSEGLDTAIARLHEVLMRELRTGDDELDRDALAKVAAVVDQTVAVLTLGDDASNAQIDDQTAAVYRLTANPKTLRRFMAAMADYARRAATARGMGTAESAIAPVSPRLASAFWRVQAASFLRQADQTEIAIAEQYVVDAGLVDTGGSDPRDLRWLKSTHVKAASLALWHGDRSSGQLRVVGKYDPQRIMPQLADEIVTSEEFPPEGLIATGTAAGREVCVVVPVSTWERDWGLLALVAEIDPTTARETYQHWAALLSAALESQRRQEEVRRSALFDPLTGLPNRQLFVQQLDQALARRERLGTPFSVLFLDLDGFKLINDSLGHQMGDRVLRSVGAEIKTLLREIDTAARFGGDEFVILLADTDAASAPLAARRIQDALAMVHVFDGHEVVTRASIGVATSDIDYDSAEEVLRDADAAMYRAKTSEPGSVAYFDTPMHEGALRRATLAREVLRALQENQFEVHYQPIVNLATGRADRFEALVRWNHPVQGLIEPGEFMGELVDTSLIVQMGHWVLDEVCRQLAEWHPLVTNVSINISDKEFWSQDLLNHTLTTLKRHDLDPSLVTLEVTESVLMRRPEMALRIMQRLADAGLRLHIDDFGTGFSSLETLHRFPVEAFKIDQSFIQTLTSKENSAELISSLVKLGNALGLSVVAEGVETDEQLAFLQELGCAAGQGYLFMPAVTAETATDLLGKSLHTDGPAADL